MISKNTGEKKSDNGKKLKAERKNSIQFQKSNVLVLFFATQNNTMLWDKPTFKTIKHTSPRRTYANEPSKVALEITKDNNSTRSGT